MDNALLVDDADPKNVLKMCKWRHGDLPDDDGYGFLEGGQYLLKNWNDKEDKPDNENDDWSDYIAGPQWPYHLRNHILNILSQILRGNPVFLLSYLNQALASFQAELEYTRLRDQQMKALRPFIQPIPPSSTILHSERAVIETLPGVQFEARFIQRADASTVFETFLPEFIFVTHQYATPENTAYIEPNVRYPRDLYTNPMDQRCDRMS